MKPTFLIRISRWIDQFIRLLDTSYAQIGLAVVLVLTGYALLFSYFVNGYARQNIDQRKNELHRLVEVGLNTIEPVRQQQRAGQISPEQARMIGRDLIQRMSFTDTSGVNYLFMGSYSGEAVTQNYTPTREGTSWELVDVKGKDIVAELISAARSPAGEGYVEYQYPAPGSTQPQTKISFVVGIPEWDSYIGTGMYLGDIEAENQLYLRNSLGLMTAMFVFVFLVMYVAVRPALNSYRTLLHLFEQIIRDPDAIPAVPVNQYRTDTEGWRLMIGFQDMLRRLQESKQQVRESEERFNLAIRGATDGLWDWDIRSNQVYYSPRWKAMLGYTDTELANKFDEWRSRIHPDDQERVTTALNNHLNGQTAFYEVEHRLCHKDGSYRWILARGASVWDGNGKPYRMAGSHTDITRRKRIEEALRRRDAILESVSFAAERFLTRTGTLEANIGEVLEHLGQATGVYRIYIFQNGVDPDGDIYMREVHSWASAGSAPLPANIDVQHLSYKASGLGRWIDILGSGQLIYGNTQSLPESEQAMLLQANILSLVLVPIFVGGQWWGYIGFDEREKERDWSMSEIDALKAAANTLGSALQQDLSARAIREREEQYRSIFENTTDGMLIIDIQGRLVEANPASCAMHGYTHDEFIKLSPRSIIQQDYWKIFDDYMSKVYSGQEFSAQVMNVRKDGSTFYVEVRGAAITYGGKPHVLGVVRDITERMQAYQVLEQRVTERTRELTALLEVSHNVASTLELQPLLSLILDQLKSVLDYSGASIFIREGDKVVNVEYRGPVPVEEVMKVNIARRSGVQEVLQRHVPVIIDDVHADTPIARDFMDSGGEYMQTSFNYIRSWMGVPLMSKEWVIGVLCLDHDRPNYYTPQHARLALAIANQAAIAIENARLYEQAQQLAVLEERQRLARELHDSVSQALYGIALGARTASTLLARDPAKVSEPLNYVLGLAEAGLAEMRALIFELRPESLETEGLVAALSKQAAALHARNKTVVNTDFCDEPNLPFDVKEAFYRVSQEAMNNTMKHARATQVDLSLTCANGFLTLTISDNGSGFDPDVTYPGHLGLKSMRERIARFGGTLKITSIPGQGTCVQAQVAM
ncbi:MAG TPA: PAS domain S-box protein [Anaerolineae bacterium]